MDDADLDCVLVPQRVFDDYGDIAQCICLVDNFYHPDGVVLPLSVFENRPWFWRKIARVEHFPRYRRKSNKR